MYLLGMPYIFYIGYVIYKICIKSIKISIERHKIIIKNVLFDEKKVRNRRHVYKYDIIQTIESVLSREN